VTERTYTASAPPRGGRVLEEGVRVYSTDEPERVALERYVLSRYHDYKDIFRQMHDLRLRRLAERGF